MKQRIRLSESNLKRIVSEAVKRLLNEGMVFPNANDIAEVYWDGDESLRIHASNGDWYSVYPNYGDAYKDENKFMKELQDKIMTALQEKQIYAQVYNYENCIIIEFHDHDMAKRVEKSLSAFMAKKGFTRREPIAYEDLCYEYNGELPQNEGTEAGEGFQDVTDRIGNFIRRNLQYYGPKGVSKRALEMLKSNTKSIDL